MTSITNQRRTMYHDIRLAMKRRDEESPRRAGLPLTVSQDKLAEIARIAPRGTQYSYCAPGITEGDASSYEDALAACCRVSDETGVSHSYIVCSLPVGLRVMA